MVLETVTDIYKQKDSASHTEQREEYGRGHITASNVAWDLLSVGHEMGVEEWTLKWGAYYKDFSVHGGR